MYICGDYTCVFFCHRTEPKVMRKIRDGGTCAFCVIQGVVVLEKVLSCAWIAKLPVSGVIFVPKP
jgi:hypothetical protein